MGNLIACRTPDGCGGGCGGGGKVVLADGTVHELDRPTPVAELMLEHPRHFVVDLRSMQRAPAGTGISKVAPLPADHLLQPGKVYAMLPMARGKPAGGVSADEARLLLAAAAQTLKLRRPVPSSFLRVLGARKTEKASKVAAAASAAVGEEEKKKLGGLEEQDTEGRPPEFLMRQHSSKRWKPTLGTIVEKSLEKKVPHWLF